MTLLSVKHVTKEFALGNSSILAVNGVSFDVMQGELLGIAGESGCGKSTLSRLLIGLLSPTFGNILFDKKDIAQLKGQALLQWRKEAQLVFQQPADSLNPRMSVLDILLEPYQIHKIGDSSAQKKNCEKLLDLVALPKSLLERTPSKLSGGQKQRVAIARALALNPKLLICDEPFSALDVSTQGQMLALLKDLHNELHFACILISHDLDVLHCLTQRLGIMQAGQLVEIGSTVALFRNPQHPYTKTLLS
ncbi:MAG: ATP-binding cassette domain-containing protein [Parachlamydia sp.]|jgi:peptide/nickel transport system ATP-binding protein/oligopeptide transport system ATP-binding protein|nr:ATP-binding cassette domain-containing protein [Parachlamydia sp.]